MICILIQPKIFHKLWKIPHMQIFHSLRKIPRTRYADKMLAISFSWFRGGITV